MTVSSIDNDCIDACIYQSLHAVESIGCYTNACCHAKTAFSILARHWLVLGLCNVLISYKTNQLAIIVNHRKFLNLVLLKDCSGSLHVGLLMGCDKVVL